MINRKADRFPLLALTLVTLLAVAACATFVQPKSFTEKLAAGYIAHTAVLKATTNALAAGDIKSTDAEQVQRIAVEARRVLDGAKLAHDAGDVKTAEGRLAMASAILIELQTFLREKGS